MLVAARLEVVERVDQLAHVRGTGAVTPRHMRMAAWFFDGVPRAEIARREGFTREHATALLNEFGHRLGYVDMRQAFRELYPAYRGRLRGELPDAPPPAPAGP